MKSNEIKRLMSHLAEAHSPAVSASNPEDQPDDIDLLCDIRDTMLEWLDKLRPVCIDAARLEDGAVRCLLCKIVVDRYASCGRCGQETSVCEDCLDGECVVCQQERDVPTRQELNGR